MTDDLFDHYAREFRTAVERGGTARGRARMRRTAVPLAGAAAFAAAGATVVALVGGPAPEREAAPAKPDRTLVRAVPPPPPQLREAIIGVVDRTGLNRGDYAHSALLQANWRVASESPDRPPVRDTSVAYAPGRRADAELLARTLGIDRVALAQPADRAPRPLTIVVGERAAFDDAARAAAESFSVLGPDGQGPGRVSTAYGDLEVELVAAQLCLSGDGAGLCSTLEHATQRFLASMVIRERTPGETDFSQPFRAVGLVPDGIDHVVFHGERVPVRDNLWAAPRSRGPRTYVVPGRGTQRISGLSTEGCEDGCRVTPRSRAARAR